MTAKYTIFTDQHKEIPMTITRFPTGEVNVKLEVNPGKRFAIKTGVTVAVQGYDANTLFVLACIKNALDDLFLRSDIEGKVYLFMPYVPNARYDRHMVDGDSFGLKVFASMLNLINFHRVIVADPHSDQTPSLIKNCVVIPQHTVVLDTLAGEKDFDVLVAPDAGAAKKIYKVAEALVKPVVVMHKTRDVETGDINGVILLDELPPNAKCLIVDDICDGGRTFTEAAKVLRSMGAQSVKLFVTHGIFSKGVATLLENGIDSIYTTDSFHDWTPAEGELKVFNYF